MATEKDAPGSKLITDNRKARHDYSIEERFEAGIVLTGTEVKSCRNGKANLNEAYAAVRDGEVWLMQCHINPYEFGNRENHDPVRPRKLLLNRSEIEKLDAKVARRRPDSRAAPDVLQARLGEGRAGGRPRQEVLRQATRHRRARCGPADAPGAGPPPLGVALLGRRA